MALAIYTPERLDELLADLEAYGRDLVEAGDKKLAMYAHLVYRELKHEDAPGESRFLIGVCMASLGLMLTALSEQAQARAGVEEGEG